MKEMKKTILAATIAAAACVASAVEAPYAFKSRLSTVHRVDRRDLALTVVSVHVFCLLASLVPAWRAARMDPVVALRQE